MRADEVLPDGQDAVTASGVIVRKGSVGTFLANERIIRDATSSAAEREKRGLTSSSCFQD